MGQKIIYPNEHGGITLLMPILDCGLTLQEIARKDVPAGVPYLYVDDALVPQDNTFFNAWEADFSNPDGHGIGHDAWFAEQPVKKPPNPSEMLKEQE